MRLSEGSAKGLSGVLDFLKVSEQLKNTLRSGISSNGRKESVAEHTWRLCLFAICLEPHYPDLDFKKLFKMLIIHDLGEIINGDIPAIYQDPEDDKNEDERKDFQQVIVDLPDSLRTEFLDLWDEYNGVKSKEAQLAKALDKLETMLQHIQGKNPADFDYNFNLSYGIKYTSLDEITQHLRSQIDVWTKERMSN